MFKDMTGIDNGYVKVIEFYKKGRFGKTRSHRLWKCICRCGKEMILSTNQIIVCIPKGCCYKQQRPGNKYKHDMHVTHGFARIKNKHPLYVTWLGIKARCNNPKNKAYKYYGAKGIKVAEEWLEFKNFYEWAISNNWKKGLVFDRIDSVKDYSPQNCQLITQSENSLKLFKKNENKILEIRNLLAKDLTNKAIAQATGYHVTTISKIKNNRTWKHLK